MARHIARVAARLFATQGYAATSVREIVEGAQVAKPTLYYYFRSKEGLAKALVTVPLGNLVLRLEQIATAEKDPVRCLEELLEAHFEFCREDPDRGRFIFALIFGPPGETTTHFLDCEKQDMNHWVELGIRRLAEARIIRKERIATCCTFFRGLMIISTLDFLYGDKPLGKNLARKLVGEMLSGFDERKSFQPMD